MNKLNAQQTGGFPLETNSLEFMQASYTFLQSLAALAGDNYILSGCVENAGNVSAGVIVTNGEVIEFRGGLKQDNIVIREERTAVPFENGQVKDAYITRYANFGTGINSIPWINFIRLKNLQMFRDLPHESSSAIDVDDDRKLATSKAVKILNDKINAILPSGIIVVWKGFINQIPVGWKLCEDLRDKFVIGAGLNYPVGAVGGEAEHTLAVGEMPRHRMTLPFPGTKSDVYGSGVPSSKQVDGWEAYGNVNMQSNEIGGDQPHNNMPPYYALAYIEKI